MPAPAATTGTIALSEHLHIEQLCPLCIILPIVTGHPHIVTGPVTSGSQDVFINMKPAARVTDQGVAVPCCNKNTYMITKGSPTVFINGLPAARVGDMTQHCLLYPGTLMANGSTDVFIGESSSMGMGVGDGDAAQQDGDQSGGDQGILDGPKERESPPGQAPALWTLRLSNGEPARGFTSRFSAPGRGDGSEVSPDGSGKSQQQGLGGGSHYAVTFVGHKSFRARFQDAQGQPAKGVRLLVERAWGPPESLVTDGGGAVEVKGLLEGEPVEIEIVSGPSQAKVRFVDEQGAALPGVELVLCSDSGDTAPLRSDGAGGLSLPDLLPGEGFVLSDLQGAPTPAKGRFVDEQGRPLENIAAVLHTDGGAAIHVISGADGRFQAEGLSPKEGYRLEVQPGQLPGVDA